MNPKEVEQFSLFQPGQLVATPEALQAFQDANQTPAEFLARHLKGDWEDLEDADKQENELSLKKGFRLLSTYRLTTGTKIWVITEADRSATTILLPDEY